jgi:hypothetical protein
MQVIEASVQTDVVSKLAYDWSNAQRALRSSQDRPRHAVSTGVRTYLAMRVLWQMMVSTV